MRDMMIAARSSFTSAIVQMRNLTSALLLLLAFCVNGNAQSTNREIVPDTLRPETGSATFYATLDSLRGDTLYVIEGQRGFVIRPYGSSLIKIAVKAKKGFNVFDGDPNGVGGAYSFSSIDFNGVGQDELLINWSDQNGRGGFIDGWSESTGGFLLWDLDNFQLLFEMQDRYDYNYWYNGVEYDSLGEFLQDSLGNVIYNDSLAGSESSCENYNVDIAYRKITVAFSLDCVDAETETDPYDEPAVYIWAKPERKR